MNKNKPITLSGIEKEFWDDFWIAHDWKGEKLGELIAAFYRNRIEEILEYLKEEEMTNTFSKKASPDLFSTAQIFLSGYNKVVKKLNAKIAKIKDIRGEI